MGIGSLDRKNKDQVKMGRVGFEPTTNALKGHCSSTELPTQTDYDFNDFRCILPYSSTQNACLSGSLLIIEIIIQGISQKHNTPQVIAPPIKVIQA